MKNILTITVAILLVNFVRAQNPVVPIYNTPDGYGYANGEYYKDTYNDYDRFEGTWQYINGNDTLVIVLEKKEMQHIYYPDINFDFYEDLLIGEYRYVENGVEKVNTLPNLQTDYNNPDKYNLSGGIIEKYNPNASPGYCLGCNPGEVKVGLSFSEPNVNIKGSSFFYYFRHFVENGVEKLELTMYDHGLITHVQGTASLNNEYSIPIGDYVLTKQP